MGKNSESLYSGYPMRPMGFEVTKAVTQFLENEGIAGTVRRFCYLSHHDSSIDHELQRLYDLRGAIHNIGTERFLQDRFPLRAIENRSSGDFRVLTGAVAEEFSLTTIRSGLKNIGLSDNYTVICSHQMVSVLSPIPDRLEGGINFYIEPFRYNFYCYEYLQPANSQRFTLPDGMLISQNNGVSVAALFEIKASPYLTSPHQIETIKQPFSNRSACEVVKRGLGILTATGREQITIPQPGLLPIVLVLASEGDRASRQIIGFPKRLTECLKRIKDCPNTDTEFAATLSVGLPKTKELALLVLEAATGNLTVPPGQWRDYFVPTTPETAESIAWLRQN